EHQFVLEQLLTGQLIGGKLRRQHGNVRFFEVIGRLFDLVWVKHVSVGDPAERSIGPNDVEYAFLALDIHAQTFESIRDLAHDRPAIQSADLLEVSELGNFHAVEPDLPA